MQDKFHLTQKSSHLDLSENNRPGGGGENIYKNIYTILMIALWSWTNFMLKFDYCCTESNHFFFLRKSINLFKKFFWKLNLSMLEWEWNHFLTFVHSGRSYCCLLHQSQLQCTYTLEKEGIHWELEQEERRIKYIRNLCVLGVENSQLLWLHLTVSYVPFTVSFPLFSTIVLHLSSEQKHNFFTLTGISVGCLNDHTYS